MRNGVNDAAKREIVIGHRRSRTRMIRTSTSRVVVGKIEQHERRQLKVGSFVFFASAKEGAEFVEKLVGAQLVGIIGIEIGEKRIEVIAQRGL